MLSGTFLNSIVSSRVNQVYQVMNGGVKCLIKDAGTASMTNPDNLAAFIQWCAKEHPPLRRMLFSWELGNCRAYLPSSLCEHTSGVEIQSGE